MYRKFHPRELYLTSKECRVCLIRKGIEEFGISRSYKSGRNSRCLSCSSEYIKNFRTSKHSRYRKQEDLNRIYGLSLEQYDSLLEKRNYRCDICGVEQSSLRKGLCIDHCHDTGKIRGILCGTCNRWIIGAVKTSSLLRAAADYLDNADTGYKINSKYLKGVRSA